MENEIQSLTDLIEVVSEWENQNPERGHADHWIWYRGQPNAEDEPLPCVLRPKFIEEAHQRMLLCSQNDGPFQMELKINNAFRRVGAALLNGETDLTRIYFLAQHHGLPTRLLDWTTNPLVALFFAVCSEKKKDGKLFVTKYNDIEVTTITSQKLSVAKML